MSTPQLSLRRAPAKPPPPGVVVRSGPAMAGLPLDEIVRKTRESAERRQYQRLEELDHREAVLAAAETRLAERERAHREEAAAVIERSRELSEQAMLADAREAKLSEREALLADNADSLARATAIARLHSDLAERDRTILALEQKLAQHAARTSALETELEQIEEELTHLVSARQLNASETAAGSRDGVAVAPDADLLAEREAFIAVSEERLFHKAQELQELEEHLLQLREAISGARAPDTAVAVPNEDGDAGAEVPAEREDPGGDS